MVTLMQDSLPTVAIVSILTVMLTEIIKKIHDKADSQYVSQIIALVVSVILTLFVCLVEAMYFDMVVDAQFWCKTATVGLLSLLSATHGYDFVVSSIAAIQKVK